MILHLQSAGVPVSWSVVSVYKGYLGIACKVAQSQAEPDEKGRDCPQAVIEILGSDEEGWRIDRSYLFMGASNLGHQHPDWDRSRTLIQEQTAPFPLPEGLAAACRAEIRRLLVEFGYLISEAEWRTRYPAQALMQDRFSEFNRAYRDAGGELEYEPRWAVMMEAPDDYEHPARFENGAIELRQKDGAYVPVDAAWLADLDEETRLNVCRYVNGGWSLDEARTMITPEPVDGPAGETA